MKIADFFSFHSDIPSWYQKKDGNLFDLYLAYKKIGSCSFVLVENQKTPRDQSQYFPDSWYDRKNSENMKPVMEITGLIVPKNKGYGRLCLQALYELSCRRNSCGRIQVLADFGSAPFYEHCGFSGGKTGQDGLKYFNPTAKNLKLLYPKGIQNEKFKFVPVRVQKSPQQPCSSQDKVLFDRMLQKANMKTK